MRAFEAEAAFTAAVVSGGAPAEAYELDPAALPDPGMRRAYEAARMLWKQGADVDPVNVAEAAGDRSLVGFARAEFGAPSAVGHYKKTLDAKWRARQFAAACSAALESMSEGASVSDASGPVVEAAIALGRESKAWAYEAPELAKSARQRLTEAMEGTARPGVSTGLRRLDDALGGLCPGHLVVVGARPKMGKTAFACTLALTATAAGVPVGFFSAEMPHAQLVDRMLSVLSGVPYRALVRGSVDDRQASLAFRAADELEDRPLVLSDQPGAGAGDVVRQIRAWHAKHDTRVVFVDHLARLKVPGRTRRDLEMSDICRQLKTVAGELGITVVLLAQLSRQLEQRPDKRPMMCDIREAGGAEEEADAVLMLYRDSVYNENAPETEAEVLVEANRHGPSGVIPAHFAGETMTWMDQGLAGY